MDITPLLEHAQSPDAALRNQAEQQLKQLEEQNAVAYLTALASELASSHKPAGARQIAGLILKNALDAPDEKKKVRRSLAPRTPIASRSVAARFLPRTATPQPTATSPLAALQAGQAARWETMDAAVKQHVKSALLATLPSDVSLLLVPIDLYLCM